MHPDEHAIVFIPTNPAIAFVGSDGGVVRVDVTHPADDSAPCATSGTSTTTAPARSRSRRADLTDCQTPAERDPEPRSTPLNDGLNTIQFQSLSVNPANPTRRRCSAAPRTTAPSPTRASPTWIESSAATAASPASTRTTATIRYHNYFDATPEVNFDGNDPKRVARHLRPAPGHAGEPRRSTRRSSPTRTSPGRAFIGLRARLAHRRQRRHRVVPRGHTATRSTSTRAGPAVRRLGSRSART